MKKDYLSTQPYKGARDFYPEDMRLRQYIFNTWRNVAQKYGFEEYDFPILENLEVFASKSGEEIVNTQLYSFEDKGGRKVSIRPELTPSTVRMIAAKYNEIPKPIKWFMIGNDWRFEKPQNGRGREFYQLEMNTFGINEVEADFEIFTIMVEILTSFGATKEMFQIHFNDRRLLTCLLSDQLGLDTEKQIAVRRLMDKRAKLDSETFISLIEALEISNDIAQKIETFMQLDFTKLSQVIDSKLLELNEGYINLNKLFNLLEKFGLDAYCKFDAGIIRGFDYSDGLVYEVFSLNKEYARSIFGGERFDKLINIYGDFALAATGFAISDVSLLAFLKVWNLIPKVDQDTTLLVTRFSEEDRYFTASNKAAQELRKLGLNVELYLTSEKLEKQFKYADKKSIPWVVVIGPDEIDSNKVALKNMFLKTQQVVELENIVSLIK